MYTALIALAAAAAALPGNAPRNAAPKTTAQDTEVASSEAGQVAAKPIVTRYCIVEVPTGSHLRRKTCQTRQEWLDQGFDPLSKN